MPCSAEDDTFGFSYVPIRENSDNYIPVPYAKTPLWTGTLGEAPSVDGTLATLTLPDCPGPTVPCYVRFRSGPLAGRYYHTTTGSTTGSIIVDTNGDSQLALAVEGDEAALIPFWTLGEYLPPTGFEFILPRASADTSQCRLMDGDFQIASLVHLHGQGKRFPTNTGAPFYDPSHFAPYNELNGGLGDQTTNPVLSVLFPDLQSAGTNLPLVNEAWPVAEVSSVDYLPGDTGYDPLWGPTHFIHSTTHWLDAAGNNLDSRILPPDSFVVLRVGTLADNPGHGAYLALGGTNEDHPVTVPLSTDGSSLQDTIFSFPIVRPTPFQNIGWIGGLLSGTDAFNPGGDELYAYWPYGSPGFQRTADAVFYPTVADGWVDGATLTTLPPEFLIPAHTVFLVRKAPTGNGATSFLQVNPTN